MLTRLGVLSVVLGAVVAVGSLTPASADEPLPTPAPSLSPPSQQQIDDAKEALERLANQGKQGRNGRSPDTLTQVAGATDDPGSDAGSVITRIQISDEAWWTLGAGLLVLLVASDSRRVTVRRAKHRKGA